MNVQPSVHDAMLGAVPQLRAFAMRLCRNVDQADETLSIPAAQFVSVEGQELRAALAELPEPERVALVMVLGAGYEYEEVGRTLGCPTGTVKSRVSRGRRKILSRLSGDAGGTSAPAAFH